MNQPDGWIVIGTELDNTNLEKDLRRTTSELQRYSKENEKLLEQKAKIELDLSEYEKEKQLIQESTDETLKKAQTEEQVNWVLDEEKMELEQLNQKYSEQFQKLGIINEKIEKNKASQQLLTEQAQKYSDEIRKTKGLDSINKSVNKINNSLGHVIRRVGHWAVAVIGVYSAYSFVRQAMSTLSQYDKTLAADLEYIRFAIATALKPVVEFIVDLIYKLLGYTRYLLNAWFGIDIFANASASAFKRAKESLKSSANSAKEIKKQLAGFDEMNILVDTTQKDTNKDSDFTMPSHDLAKGLEGDVPEWLRWLGENKDWILPLLAGIAGAFLAMKLGFEPLKALGIAGIIIGIIYAIEGLFKYLKNPTWENFGQVIQGIGLAFLGLALVIGSPVLAIVGACIFIFGTIVKYWDKIRNFLQGGIDWLTGKSDWVHKHFGDIIGDIYDIIVGRLQKSLDGLNKLFTNFKEGFDNLIDFVKNVFAGNWEGAWENVKNIFSNFMENLWTIFKAFTQPMLDIIDSIVSWVFPSKPSKGVASGSVKGISKRAKGGIFYPSKLPKLALGGIINQPGRGVPYNGAIIGERGAEAVLPLTDSQQMALLGEAIGKYITINANITNTMNGRVISRELQKVQSDNDFAFNR